MIKSPLGLVFMKFSKLGSYKVLNTHVFFPYLFVIFEILSDPTQIWFLVVLKCCSKEFWSYRIRIFYPLVDVSICFSLLLDFVVNACSEVDNHFDLFEFAVVLMWETMTFIGLYGDPTGITLLKFNFFGGWNQWMWLVSCRKPRMLT